MKKIAFYICLALGLSFTACENEEYTNEGIFELSQTTFKDLSYEGEEVSVDVTAYDGWVATGQPNWCRLSEKQGRGKSTLRISVDANIYQDRSCVIELRTQKETKSIHLSQKALPEGEELHYKLPIVIHVIYNDPTNPQQNPDGAYLQRVLAEVNQAYKQAGPNSVDLNMEFVPATVDPQGNVMKEPGIDRIQWVSGTLDMQDVMFSEQRKYHHFLWDPNKYVNVLLYTFDESNPQMAGVMGVSTFPYSPALHPMEGTETIPYTHLTLDNVKFSYCVSINNKFVGDHAYLFPGYELDTKQSSLTNTLAHELGHFFGLRHVFSESQESGCADTDYCKDTKSYNKSLYEANLINIVEQWQDDPSYRTDEHFYETFMRQCCDNSTFEAHNIMDYSYCYSDEFTADQRIRVRHVLEYSPLIPGPKRVNSLQTRAVAGEVDLPITVMCMPQQ